MDNIGKRIQSARKSAKITQVQLAKMVGMTQQSLSLLERGESNSTRKVVDIAEVLGVSAHWLVNGTDGPDIKVTDPQDRDLYVGKLKLEISDKSMEPDFLPGHTIYYSPGTYPEPGEIVAVKIGEKLCIRKFRVINKGEERVAVLTPHSADFPEINADEAEVLGVACQHVIPLSGRVA